MDVSSANPKKKSCFRDIAYVDSVLALDFSRDDPAYPALQLLAYVFLDDGWYTVLSCRQFRDDIKSIMDKHGAGRFYELIEKVRWIISPDGVFSIFDSLVLSSQGAYCCGAPETIEAWNEFSVHDGDFHGCLGIMQHDFSTHAGSQNILAERLKKFSIPFRSVVSGCCDPKVLAQNDMVTLCEQIQAWFVHFRELPSEADLSRPDDLLFSLLFPVPEDNALSDPGFEQITPCFAAVPAGYDWRKQPLPVCDASPSEILSALLSWRSQHCVPVSRFLMPLDLKAYLRLAASELLLVSDGDVHRFREFVEQVRTHRAETNMIARLPIFDSYAEAESKISAAQGVFSSMSKAVLAVGDDQWVKVSAPLSVCLLVLLMHADFIKKAKCSVEFCLSDVTTVSACTLSGELDTHL